MSKHLLINAGTLTALVVLLFSNVPATAQAQSGKGGTQFVPPQPATITRGGSSLQTTCTPVSASQTITTEGFEGVWPPANGSWAVTGNPTWDDTNYKAHSGSWSGWAAKGGTLGVDPSSNDYLNNMDSWMIYGPFDLSKAVAARVTFYYWNLSESNFDRLYWMASADNSIYGGYQVSGDSGGWQSVSFDLTNVPTVGNLAGQSCVWIAFRFASDASITMKGPFVDDIVIDQPRWGAYYNPNPVVTSGDTSLRDNNNADSSVLTSQRVQRGLLGLDGTGYLRGSYADLTALGINGPVDCGPSQGFTFTGKSPGLANEPSLVYLYTRSDDRFEEVNAYATIDAMERYIQSLGFTNIVNHSIAVYAHCMVDDNAAAINNTGIVFGDGGVDTAEDGEVIAHEYGHVIQHDRVTGWGAQPEGRAMGEGFGDYWSASFFSSQNPTADYKACIGEWAATSFSPTIPPCVRRVDGTKHYPNDLSGEQHNDGEIWSAALWQLWNSLGRARTDVLVLKSYDFLDQDARFGEGVDALFSADSALLANVDFPTLATVFRQRGILDAYEWDATASLASSITVNGSAQSHGFHSIHDTDWVKFNATAFGPSWRNAYLIRTFGLATNVNTMITLYGPDGVTALASNDNCPASADGSSCLTWAMPTTGTYYVKVEPVLAFLGDLASTGANKTYQIQVTTLPLPNSAYMPLIMN